MNVSTQTRHYWLQVLLIILCLVISLLCPTSRVCASLADLSDLSKIEKSCLDEASDDGNTNNIKKELVLIRKSLTTAPAYNRPFVLRRLYSETKWGTLERIAAYYISAWYGIDYRRCRDYIFNFAFHYDSVLMKLQSFNITQECGLDLLYQLYQHNHDFRLLHNLFIKKSGEHKGEMLYDIRLDAITNHPRGVLHVAAMSNEGRKALIEELIYSYEIDPSASYKEIHYRELFLMYCRRVAKDSNDPLREAARRILRETKGSIKPLKVHKY